MTQIERQIEEEGADSNTEIREALRREACVKRFEPGPNALTILMDKSKGKAKPRQSEMNVFNRKIHFRIDGNDNLILIDLTIIDNNKVVAIVTNIQDFESDLQANSIRDWYEAIRNVLYYIIELAEKVKKVE